MTSYDEWNRKILTYVTEGIPLGTKVYLSIDDDALRDIGSTLAKKREVHDYVTDFKLAIRSRCVQRGKVQIATLIPKESSVAEPPYVAFLSATVLAAQHMGEEEEISHMDYFTRLNKILGFSDCSGRPPGLSSGSEEVLWKHWNTYLRSRGFLPSARSGVGPRRYIQYPISQTLLRETDKDNLWRLFTNHNWPYRLDEETVAARIRRSTQYMTQHLQRQLEGKDADSQHRYQALIYEIYDLYDSWQRSEGKRNGRLNQSLRSRNLSAGLYRTVSPFSASPSYYVFPRQARRMQLQNGRICYKNTTHFLKQERPGWYQPLWEITPNELRQGLQVEVKGKDNTTSLVLPSRQFWILVPDPDFSESGVYASWGRPTLGDDFTLLYMQQLQEDLDHLRDEGLIKWGKDPVSLAKYPGWFEMRGVMVVSDAWSGVSISNRDLYESLRPAISLSIHLSGGLRLHNSRTWLINSGPQVTVYSFYPLVSISIIDADTDSVVESFNVTVGQQVNLDWNESGSFLVETSSGEAVSERLVRIIDWTEVPIESISSKIGNKHDSFEIFGALVSEED
jgi:hypothetical protein